MLEDIFRNDRTRFTAQAEWYLALSRLRTGRIKEAEALLRRLAADPGSPRRLDFILLIITSVIVEPDPANPGKYRFTVTAAGGVPYSDGYRYRRCNSLGAGCTGWQVSNVLSNIPTGSYIVRVRDKNNCVAEQAVLAGGAARLPDSNEIIIEKNQFPGFAQKTFNFCRCWRPRQHQRRSERLVRSLIPPSCWRGRQQGQKHGWPGALCAGPLFNGQPQNTLNALDGTI